MLNLHTFQDRSCLLTPPKPPFFPRKAVLLHTLLLHLDAIPGLCRSLVVPVLDNGRMVEMLMQMVYVFQYRELAGNTYVIDGAEVLSVFT